MMCNWNVIGQSTDRLAYQTTTGYHMYVQSVQIAFLKCKSTFVARYWFTEHEKLFKNHYYNFTYLCCCLILILR